MIHRAPPRQLSWYTLVGVAEHAVVKNGQKSEDHLDSQLDHEVLLRMGLRLVPYEGTRTVLPAAALSLPTTRAPGNSGTTSVHTSSNVHLYPQPDGACYEGATDVLHGAC